jgi:hypothetical protein
VCSMNHSTPLHSALALYVGQFFFRFHRTSLLADPPQCQ